MDSKDYIAITETAGIDFFNEKKNSSNFTQTKQFPLFNLNCMQQHFLRI